MSQYSERMKTAIKTCQSETLKQLENIKRYRAEYLPGIAAEKEKEAYEAISRARATAAAEIRSTADDYRKNIETWGTLKPAEITDDSKFLTANVNLSADEIRKMVDKYSNNGTMCRLIEEYVDKRNIGKDLFSGDYIFVNIPTVGKKMRTANAMEKRALSLLETVTHEGYLSGPADPLVIKMLEAFDEIQPEELSVVYGPQM